MPHCGAIWPTSVLQEVSWKIKLLGNCRGGSRRPHATTSEWAIAGCTKQPGEKNCLWESAPKCVLSCPIVVQFGPQVFCGKFLGKFQETAKATAGRTPKFENGLLRTAPINPGGKPTYRKVPSDLGCVLPHCAGAVRPASALRGGFLETSKKLPGRQPAAPQNLRMGCCALHQSIRGKKHL